MIIQHNQLMMIYTSPDRTQYPDTLQVQVSNELEPLTGADMLITSFPFDFDASTLEAHIKSRALFIQIKIGYDALSFDGIHNFCARVQKCQIPKSQAILLLVGDFWRDENGLFRVRKQAPYGNTTWRNWRRAIMGCEMRGITVFPEFLPSIDELPDWIEDYQEMIQKVETEGKRELYPTRQVPIFEPDDIWQEIEEIDKTDPRYTLVAGLDKFGEARALSTHDYILNELKAHPDLFMFLKVLTDEDEKGKPIHKIPKWGDKSRKDLRDRFSLSTGFNLSIEKIGNGISDIPYQNGWQAGLERFGKLLQELADNNNGKVNLEVINKAFDTAKKLGELTIEF